MYYWLGCYFLDDLVWLSSDVKTKIKIVSKDYYTDAIESTKDYILSTKNQHEQFEYEYQGLKTNVIVGTFVDFLICMEAGDSN